MADISQTSQGSENCFFFSKNEGTHPHTHTHCISDRKAKHVHVGNTRTMLNYVARIFTFLQPKINDVRRGAQLKRWTAILYSETRTQNYRHFVQKDTQLQSWCTCGVFCGILLHLTNKYISAGQIQFKKIRPTILSVVLYGCKTGLLQVACQLRTFKNRALRKGFG